MATPEQLRQYYQSESLNRYSTTGQRQAPLPRLYTSPAARSAAQNATASRAAAARVAAGNGATTGTSPTVPKQATAQQRINFAQQEALNKYSTAGQRQSPLPDLSKIKTGFGGGSRGMAPGAPSSATASAAVNTTKTATTVATATNGAASSTNAAAGARTAVNTAVQTALNFAKPAVSVGSGVTVGTIGRSAAVAVGLVLLDPTVGTSDGTATGQQKRLNELDLMPEDPPQEIEPVQYQFQGGQENDVLYIVSWVAMWERLVRPNDEGYDPHKEKWYFMSEPSAAGVSGPISGIVVTQAFRFSQIIALKYIETNKQILKSLDLDYNRNLSVKILSVVRADGRPDTSGNPPPIQQASYTTNITNIYNAPPQVNQTTSAAPTITVSPTGVSPQTAPDPASSTSPAPPLIIPELNPEIPRLTDSPSPTETQPDTAESSPAQTYPKVTVTPSSGITATAAATNISSGLQVSPSTGVKADPLPFAEPETQPLVKSVPEEGQRPNVDNPQRLPQFLPPRTQTATNSESAVDGLLQLEQSLIQLRVSISSLSPSGDVESLSRTIKALEDDIAFLT